jgi:hypothetical protein
MDILDQITQVLLLTIACFYGIIGSMIQYKSDPSLYRSNPKSFAKNLMEYATFISDNTHEEIVRKSPKNHYKDRAPMGAAYIPRYVA